MKLFVSLLNIIIIILMHIYFLNFFPNACGRNAAILDNDGIIWPLK